MGKTVTLNLRVSPDAKQGAEAVLKQLGLPMSTAIDLYLRQISLTNSIPFSISLPKAPSSVNADFMSVERLEKEILLGCEEADKGETLDAKEVFSEFREKHS